MTDDLSTADARQLERWAFGRQDAVADRERADSALRELERRAELARAEAARAEPARLAAETEPAEHATRGARDEGAEDAGGEHSESPEEQRHRQRMLRTGRAGVVAALLALSIGSVVLSQPNPDPNAPFDRPPTAEDLGWESFLEEGFGGVITGGPRVVDLGQGLEAIVFRSAAVADGRSTAFDPYCIAVIDGSKGQDRGIINGACALPERLNREGLALPMRPAENGGGFELVSWGPTGGPRLESTDSFNNIGAATSVLDWMTYPLSLTDTPAIVDEPDLLLLGPATVPLFSEGSITGNITTVAYLLRGRVEGAEPVLCVSSTVREEGETRGCAPLSAVRRDGLEYTITADGRVWVVSIGADGPDRQDTLRAGD